MPREYNYKIVQNKGHYEVYINKKFYCSADSWPEAVREVEEYYEVQEK